ncbi:MAG: hsdR [Proteobacteria bacterium]|nr:hsdR [Pseudomonadota bacterium]
MADQIKSNFDVLKQHDKQLWRLGALAERYFTEDPNTCLLKLRQLAEMLAQTLAAHTGLLNQPAEAQLELLRRLNDRGVLPRDVAQLFHQVRKEGNEANHALKDDHGSALQALRLSWQLSLWFHRTLKDPHYKSGPFIPPAAPVDESEALRTELTQLREALATYQQSHEAAAAQLQATRLELSSIAEERELWAQLANEADQAKAELAAQLAAQQAAAVAEPKGNLDKLISAASKAASLLQLDEKETRKLIDEQLQQAGWEADTVGLDYRKGARPQAGRNMAIAEWPAQNAACVPKRADYVLFVGLRPVAIVEAKRYGNDVADDLRQAEEYAAGLILKDVQAGVVADGAVSYLNQWVGLNGINYLIPFVYASNARPWLQQLQTKSGIWHRDLRDVNNHSRPLMNWHRPEELLALLAQNQNSAEQALAQEPFAHLNLRDYQERAIRRVEQALHDGQRSALLAMATGTGKTRTIIGLIYRLLNSGRFNRILFLVDRNSLGTQAQDAFKEYRLEGGMLFSSIYDIKELEDREPDSKTRVHVATVQAMVRRIFETDSAMPIRRYDCIIVDEAHRGYVLDRGMSEGEMVLRDEEDYISSYRRVLDYFDAIRIGLTATPALHTVEIFGHPVFTYTYSEAVVDGYLVDHEPPISFETELMQNNIRFEKGSEVDTVTLDGELNTETLADDLVFEIDAFNRAVVNENFSKVIVDKMARDYLDPTAPEKTLVFCVTDVHADLVVDLFKKALVEYHGPQPDGLVQKITGSVRDPVGAIRQFRTQPFPRIVVTVDLLTTGVDVPAITNLLFMRRVRSRILYEQMKGRATRLCDEFPKDTFRIYDAVRLYQALAAVDTMQPSTPKPRQTLEELVGEILDPRSDELAGHVPNKPEASHADQVLNAVLARFQRLQRQVERNGQKIEVQEALEQLNRTLQAAGSPPLAEIVPHLKAHGPKAARELFKAAPRLLDKLSDLADAVGLREKLYISTHADKVVDVIVGYGKDKDGNPITRPQDYLAYFNDFIRNNLNQVTALQVIATRPKSLTRADLRELALWLDTQGFGEKAIAKAWHDARNVDIAASIIGYIRQAALGDPLLPFAERVDRAVARILQSRSWTPNQEKALKFIAERIKHSIVIDSEFWQSAPVRDKYGANPFERLNQLFDGEFGLIVDQLADHMWAAQA